MGKESHAVTENYHRTLQMPSKFYNVFQLIAQYFPQELVETNKELKGK